MERFKNAQPVVQWCMNSLKNLGKYATPIGIILYSEIGSSIVTSVASTIKSVLGRLFMSRAFLTSKDEAFHWIMLWISENEYSSRANHFSVLTSKTYFDFSTHFFNMSPSEKDKNKIPVKFVPSPGTHIVKFEGKYLIVKYSKQSGGSNNSESDDQLIISTIGYQPYFLRAFITHCQETYVKSKHGKTLIYVPDIYCDNWEPRICRNKRDPSTVVLKSDLYEGIKTDAQEFLANQSWYHRHGIPFRRGYLLHGPPGTGKSSAVVALAGDLDMNICMVNLTAKSLSDEKLSGLLLSTPYNSIILLEDIDHAIEHTAKASANHKSIPEDVNDNDDLSDIMSSPISLAGLLNCIDGVIAQEGRLVFMTTNSPHKLPEALVRPGRVDVKHLVDYSDEEQCRKMFVNFYGEESQEQASRFVSALKKVSLAGPLGHVGTGSIVDKKITTAQLQGHFLIYKDKAEEAIRNADRLFV
ncbi:mitochondrial chaperone BCS1 [Acrasis kona]|uniref:Mitochondrial chaperone BCS1 n=1 Tax=Acrasis kona TaxID=1008807 RepID=A0AAW2YZB6_9EUKA